MKRVTLRGGVEIEDPFALALASLEAYSAYDSHDSPDPASFDETDLRHANRGGARISAVEIAGILERRGRIERALGSIDPGASLAAPARSIPWDALTELFDAFGNIRGVGLSKMTKALYPKRPMLIPMLDSVVQAYLAIDDPPDSFADRASALVRSYKRDLDRNRSALRSVRRELAARGHELTEVRILDILIWSAFAEG